VCCRWRALLSAPPSPSDICSPPQSFRFLNNRNNSLNTIAFHLRQRNGHMLTLTDVPPALDRTRYTSHQPRHSTKDYFVRKRPMRFRHSFAHQNRSWPAAWRRTPQYEAWECLQPRPGPCRRCPRSLRLPELTRGRLTTSFAMLTSSSHQDPIVTSRVQDCNTQHSTVGNDRFGVLYILIIKWSSSVYEKIFFDGEQDFRAISLNTGIDRLHSTSPGSIWDAADCFFSVTFGHWRTITSSMDEYAKYTLLLRNNALIKIRGKPELLMEEIVNGPLHHPACYSDHNQQKQMRVVWCYSLWDCSTNSGLSLLPM